MMVGISSAREDPERTMMQIHRPLVASSTGISHHYLLFIHYFINYS